MARYLLSCDCGANLPIEAGQAGRQVTCSCGRTLDVPALRMLRHLPQAAASEPEKRQAQSHWSVRHGIAALSLLFAGLLVGVAAWSRFNEPSIPEFNSEAHTAHMSQQIDRLTPEQAWQLWVYQYQPLAEAGFTQMENRQEPAIRAYIDNQRFFQSVMLILAGVFGVAALSAAMWPGSQTRKA